MKTSQGRTDSAERDDYWRARYNTPDWSGGIHIGRFTKPDMSLAQAADDADEHLVRQILDTCSVFRLMTNFRVLEIGCGTGELAVRMAAILPKVEYRGCDISDAAINTANKKISQLSRDVADRSNIRMISGGISALTQIAAQAKDDPANDGFDLVVIREVYYLLSDQERSDLTTIIRHALRPGGFVYFADLFSTSDQASEVAKKHLYGRHRSPGRQLAVKSASSETVMVWLKNVFGTEFGEPPEPDLTIDQESIGKTYEAALREAIHNRENAEAYRSLARIATPDRNGRSGLIYVRAFLLFPGKSLESAFLPSDFKFKALRSYHEVMLPGRCYGAFANKWNLVLGRSGEGKTSLLRALRGDLPEVTGMRVAPVGRKRVFLLGQITDIFDGFSAIENVTVFGPSRSGAKLLLQQLGVASRSLMSKSSGHLSGGEKQRIAIAQCLGSQAEVVLLDEPLKGLDGARRLSLFEMLEGHLRNSTRTLVCVDHDFERIQERFEAVFELIQGYQIPLKVPGLAETASLKSVEHKVTS